MAFMSVAGAAPVSFPVQILGSETDSEIMAVCAVLIALSALFVSVLQAYLTRKHNRLSVRPHLELIKNISPSGPASIVLKNHGTGPAIIKKIRVYVDKEEYFADDDDSFKAALEKLGISERDITATYCLYEKNAILGIGAEQKIMEFYNSRGDETVWRYIAQMIDRIGVKVEFQCIYGCIYLCTLNA